MHASEFVRTAPLRTMAIAVAAAVIALALFSSALAREPPPNRWGTYRPRALIGVRARVPHSPQFGFAFHAAHTADVRHLAADPAIRAFSWHRHDGRGFGDQAIDDARANLRVRSRFLAHSELPDAWVLRVSGSVLDRASKRPDPVSLVFYAAAGPEEEDGAAPDQWGGVRFRGDTGGDEGTAGDVLIDGSADSVDGAFSLVVRSPNFGSMSAVEPSESIRPDASSRSRLRRREDVPLDDGGGLDKFHVAAPKGAPETSWMIEDKLQALLADSLAGASASATNGAPGGKKRRKIATLGGGIAGAAPTLFVQRVLQVPFELDVVFSGREKRSESEFAAIVEQLSGDSLQRELGERRASFDERFERVFGLRAQGLDEKRVAFAKTALSNMLGGIGFMYGSSLIKPKAQSGRRDERVDLLPPVSLFTATPSRAAFPSGFLWDEGFHQLVVQRWDADLSMECLKSWMQAMQNNGWIPREQVLGIEARARFPQHVKHLLIQDPAIANPPTLLMPLRVIAALDAGSSRRGNGTDSDTVACSQGGEAADASDTGLQRCSQTGSLDGNPSMPFSTPGFSKYALDHVAQYYNWLTETQAGELANTFRWRGRTSELSSPEGYPLTLASGLDDYPRAEEPSNSERHVDLHCWMTWAAGALAQLSNSAGQDSTRYESKYKLLRAKLLESYSSESQIGSGDGNRDELLLCDSDGEESVCHEGYVTIIPLALGLLEPNDPRVGAILESLERDDMLRARAGVRSLSKSDIWYRKGNDYWTGSVWMPFNFLTLAALNSKYAVEEGPYRERASALFTDLRSSILETMFEVYSSTGQLWENYSPDNDGQGKSGHQFTGWSSLVVLVYANMYDGVL